MKTPSTSTSPAVESVEPPCLAGQFPPTGSEAGVFLVLAEIRSLLVGHLDRPLLKLFEELTGHCLHVLWHDPLEFHDPARLPVLCPAARARVSSGETLPAECARCQRDSWRPLEAAPDQGRLLHGVCGVTGFWAGLQVGAMRPVTLALRVEAPAPRFAQAVQLLQQFRREAQAALAAELARRELAQARRQPGLPGPVPHPLPTVPAVAGDAHGQAVVRTMLAHLHAHYAHPMGLADVAAALNMNASYLSSLFAATMGVNFHCYLGDLRLAKAKELLRDPAWHICDIAAATGFSSPNHFDNAFKASVGRTPSAWRDAQD